MEWDDSGMNITINPLEDVEKNGDAAVEPFSEAEDDQSDEDDYEDDENELSSDNDDDEDEHVLPHAENGKSGLEWDDR